jgi:hypothetical protein
MVFEIQIRKIVSCNSKMVLILESYSCGFWIKEKRLLEGFEIEEFGEKYIGILKGATVSQKVI